jgi:hypothetical protein
LLLHESIRLHQEPTGHTINQFLRSTVWRSITSKRWNDFVPYSTPNGCGERYPYDLQCIRMVLNDGTYIVVKLSRLHLTDRFPDLIAQAGLSQRAFARRAGISFSTIMGLLHPELHPGRRGGMQRRTAWMLAQAYGELVHIDADAAFRLLIVERPDESVRDIAPAEGIPHGST